MSGLEIKNVSASENLKKAGSWLIVGGTRGTGLHFVKALLREGETVEVIGRRDSPEFSEDGSQPVYHQCDLSSEDEISRLIKAFVENGKAFSTIVFFQRFRSGTPNWRKEIDVCLSSVHLFLEAVPKISHQNTNGSAIVLGSVAQDYIFPDQSAAYHVTKAGLRALVRYYAVKLGGSGFRVNMVVPATILKEEAREFYESNPDVYQRKAAASPLGRMGTPEDIERAVKFLASQDAGFVTGQEIVVDGGMTLLGHEYAASKPQKV